MATFLVCGGRHFTDGAMLNEWLNFYHAEIGITFLVHGDARGADRLAGAWARNHGIPVKAFPAEWIAHGWSAGPRRNQQMLDSVRVDYVVAFPGSAGTADMVRRAEAYDIPVLPVDEP